MFTTFESIVPDFNIQIFISAVIAITVSLRSIPVIINISNLRNLMDQPVKRSSHSTPTPTFGGVAIYAGTLIGYMMWNFGDEGNLLHKVFAGVTILFFLGIKDDIYGLSANKKMIFQIIASAIVVIGSDLRIGSAFGILGINEIPYLISVALSILFFVAIINSFNLIDGIDGLAGGVGMIASFGFGMWYLLNEHWSLACLSLSLSASLLGFLRFNFSERNKIFMGDTGSLIVGYIISVLFVKYIHYNVNHYFDSKQFVSAPILGIFLLLVPLFDTLRVFAVRILRGKSPFRADRGHLHHLMIDNELSHVASSFILYTVTIGFTFLGFIGRRFFTNTEMCIGIVGLFIIYVMIANWLEVRRLRLKKEKLTDKVTPKEVKQMKDKMSVN